LHSLPREERIRFYSHKSCRSKKFSQYKLPKMKGAAIVTKASRVAEAAKLIEMAGALEYVKKGYTLNGINAFGAAGANNSASTICIMRGGRSQSLPRLAELLKLQKSFKWLQLLNMLRRIMHSIV
jgi:uncharacterized alpha/beta hydrolase family protein